MKTDKITLPKLPKKLVDRCRKCRRQIPPNIPSEAICCGCRYERPSQFDDEVLNDEHEHN